MSSEQELGGPVIGGVQVLEVADDGARETAMAQARNVLAASRKAAFDEHRPQVVQQLVQPEATVVMPQAVNYVAPQYQAPIARPHQVHTGPRRVRLTIARLDPWSIMKLGFLLSVAAGLMAVIAVTLFWLVIDHLEVFSTLQDFINDAVGTGATVNIVQYFEFGRIVSLATLVAVVNVIIMTILAAIMALLYNITAMLVGGIRVTLRDD